MQASEMTNDELASWLDMLPPDDGVVLHGVCHEAAARLRKMDAISAKLKVAEDALEKLMVVAKNRMPTMPTVYETECLVTADKALATIRKEGEAK